MKYIVLAIPIPIQTSDCGKYCYGNGGGYGGLNFQTICASVKAVNEEDAKEIVKKSYKIRLPHNEYEMKLNWIFCEEHECGWIPNEDRFPYSKIGTFIKEKK
jgi:hypothetical protein